MNKDTNLQEILAVAQQRIDTCMKKISELGEESKRLLTINAHRDDVDAVYADMAAIIEELKPLHQAIFQANPDWASLFYSLIQWKKDKDAASKAENTFKMIE